MGRGLALALAAATALAAEGATALSCSEQPSFGVEVDRILRSQSATSGPPSDTVIAIGKLGLPTAVRCRDRDWTNSKTCTGQLRFEGRLIGPEGVTEVSGHPVTGTFYEHALTGGGEGYFEFWKPWQKNPMVLVFGVRDGALSFAHLDDCGSFNLSPLTPAVEKDLLSCARRGRCTAGERRRLDKARDKALTP